MQLNRYEGRSVYKENREEGKEEDGAASREEDREENEAEFEEQCERGYLKLCLHLEMAQCLLKSLY